MKSEHVDEGDWTCDECSFQTNSAMNLQSHVHITGHKSHLLHGNGTLENIGKNFRCKFCEMEFRLKRDLTTHIQNNHKTFKLCIKYAENKCEFGKDCLYNHIILTSHQHICFKCGEMFTSKGDLMKHIKSLHGRIQCHRYLKKECKYSDDSCMFSHQGKTNENIENNNQPSSQDFQNVSENLAPPDWTSAYQTENQNLQLKILPLLQTMMMKMLPNIMDQIMIQMLK